MTSGIKTIHVSHLFDGSQHSLPHPTSEAVQHTLQRCGWKIPYKPSLKLITSYNVPYLLGYDAKRWCAYADLNFHPAEYDKKLNREAAQLINGAFDAPALLSLLTHEEIEKKLEQAVDDEGKPLNWTYAQRHHIATWCEQEMVWWMGWDWEAYQAWCMRCYHEVYRHFEATPVERLHVPATLDMSPYVDSGEKLLPKMRKAGARDKGEEE